MKFGLIFTLQDPPHGEHLSRLYDEVFAQAALAEEAGFELFLVPEHHQMPDGYMPAPLTFAAALAAHTKRAQIGTGILQLPLYHPLHVAEQIAVIDTIAKGRFILGAGLGLVEHEFNAFEIPLSAAATRFTESVEILRHAWSGQTFSYHGQHFNFDEVTITPRPVRQPPIWVGAMSTITLTRAGRIGDGWLSDPLHHFDVMRAWSEMYRAAAQRAGNPRVDIALLRNAWVGDSQAEIERIWWPHVKDYHLFYLRLGFFSSGRFNAKWEPWVKEITSDAEWTFERVAPNRLIYGTPEQVVTELKRYEQATGCQYIILMLRCPSGPSHAQTMRCIERFGTNVLPHFA
ncbi:MAG: LLM class flavin-dependent oxidoreductase [Desulfurellaceae bacterium]|nr:LLM class flavin-dependent oxidoreductase [Desulfurellaceae bacterium]